MVTVHDLKFLKNPELFSNSDGALFFKRSTLDAIHRADCLITVSEFVKNEMVEYFNLPTDRVKVIYPGIEEAFHHVQNRTLVEKVLSNYGIKNRYILFVGFLEAKKNISRLIAAFSKIRRSLPEPYQLVIAGPYGPATKEISQNIIDLSLGEDVIMTGQVLREELPLIYNGASLFVFPSLDEGFGIPPIEAMASGTPVITSNVCSLPEVVGDGALLVNPLNVDEIAEAIHNVLTEESLQDSLRKKGLFQSKKYSWERMAMETLQLYNEL